MIKINELIYDILTTCVNTRNFTLELVYEIDRLFYLLSLKFRKGF